MLMQGNPVLTLFDAVEKASVWNEKLWSFENMAMMFASIQHYARLHNKEEMEELEGGYGYVSVSVARIWRKGG